MNNEQKERSKILASLGPKELLRVTSALLIVQFTGIALSFALRNFGFALIFIGATFGILWLFPYWHPAYAVLRKIMGNENIPPVLPKYQRKWWNYISIAIKALMLLVVLVLGIKLLFQ